MQIAKSSGHGSAKRRCQGQFGSSDDVDVCTCGHEETCHLRAQQSGTEHRHRPVGEVAIHMSANLHRILGAVQRKHTLEVSPCLGPWCASDGYLQTEAFTSTQLTPCRKQHRDSPLIWNRLVQRFNLYEYLEA